MSDVFKVPDGYQESFRRLIPYMAAPLQKDPKIFESLLIYLKLGGERLARVVIDAYNVNQRQLDIEVMRRIRDEALYEEPSEDEDEDDSEEDNEDESSDA
jgi:hypothetical protein